jgi:hypothetical protein
MKLLAVILSEAKDLSRTSHKGDRADEAGNTLWGLYLHLL